MALFGSAGSVVYSCGEVACLAGWEGRLYGFFHYLITGDRGTYRPNASMDGFIEEIEHEDIWDEISRDFEEPQS